VPCSDRNPFHAGGHHTRSTNDDGSGRARRQRVRITERHLSAPVVGRQAWGLVRGPAPGRDEEESGTVASAVAPYTTRLLPPGTWDDFAALVEANNQLAGQVSINVTETVYRHAGPPSHVVAQIHPPDRSGPGISAIKLLDGLSGNR